MVIFTGPYWLCVHEEVVVLLAGLIGHHMAAVFASQGGNGHPHRAMMVVFKGALWLYVQGLKWLYLQGHSIGLHRVAVVVFTGLHQFYELDWFVIT